MLLIKKLFSCVSFDHQDFKHNKEWMDIYWIFHSFYFRSGTWHNIGGSHGRQSNYSVAPSDTGKRRVSLFFVKKLSKFETGGQAEAKKTARHKKSLSCHARSELLLPLPWRSPYHSLVTHRVAQFCEKNNFFLYRTHTIFNLQDNKYMDNWISKKNVTEVSLLFHPTRITLLLVFFWKWFVECVAKLMYSHIIGHKKLFIHCDHKVIILAAIHVIIFVILE